MNEAAGIEASLGLTSEEAQVRIVAGEANVDAGVKTRSIGQIVHDNKRDADQSRRPFSSRSRKGGRGGSGSISNERAYSEYRAYTEAPIW